MIEIDVSKGIDVAGFHYSVDGSKLAHEDCVGDQKFGTCSTSYQIIKIDNESGFSAERISETFVHEMIEAVKQHYDRSLSHETLEKISEGIHQALKSLGIVFVINKSE